MRRKKTSKTITITTVGVDDNQSVMTAPNDGAAASVKSAEDDRELEIDFNEIDVSRPKSSINSHPGHFTTSKIKSMSLLTFLLLKESKIPKIEKN